MSSSILTSDLAQKEIDILQKNNNINGSYLKVKLLNKNARLPVRSSIGAAGYDIYAAESYVILPGDKSIISTGISIELPECPFPGHIYYFDIKSRSGNSAKFSIEKGAGVIDDDYNGELKIILYNHKPRKEKYDPETKTYSINYEDSFLVNIGDRIAQGIITPVAIPQVIEVKELCESVRGASGFGSTGR